MSNLYRMLIAALVALVAATSFAEATCGDSSGPGYRGPNGKCVGWEALGRVCGCPPSTRCTPVRTSKSRKSASTINHANKWLPRGGEGEMAVTRTHFAYCIDLCTAHGESIVEHVAGVEDYQLALATYRAAVERWPGAAITLRHSYAALTLALISLSWEDLTAGAVEAEAVSSRL
jgi:hypothetical protein